MSCSVCATCTGGGDGAEEWRNGSDRVGREHPVLVDRIQRCCVESGARRPGLATTAESSILPARIHVHHVLGQHRLRAVKTLQYFTRSTASHIRATSALMDNDEVGTLALDA